MQILPKSFILFAENESLLAAHSSKLSSAFSTICTITPLIPFCTFRFSLLFALVSIAVSDIPYATS